ncbi:UNKNOWN [Stylonychia lemnae]|uniref:Uncharacterized protein n=1 Tax=Stylonychia lemnae TaxID=5949 RepID=A0A078B608_STYLE|nr:UNKNOWN [Stylonychia lemnae]|eukprot:CDW89661.1 UNKNOWN [Stylonychia lemnae]
MDQIKVQSIINLLNPTKKQIEQSEETNTNVILEIKINYLVKSGMQKQEEQLALDREMLDLHLDLAVTSLNGKIGSADIQYQVLEYSQKDSKLKIITDFSSVNRLWNSLMMASATFDGSTAIRFDLINITAN